MKKVKIEFNPDTMTVSDLKACASTLRTILQRYELLYDQKLPGDDILSDLGLTVLQYVDSYEV